MGSSILGKVAITGGVAEGKSTVLSILKEAGYRTASADAEARLLLAEPDVQSAVRKVAGLREWSSEAYRATMLDDGAVRRRVNEYLHPLVMKRLKQLQADFVEIPLLVESALCDEFDRVWVVTCGLPEQRRRLGLRLGSAAEVERFLAMQLPTSTKLAFADLVIRTNQPLSRVKAYTLEKALTELKTCIAHRAK